MTFKDIEYIDLDNESSKYNINNKEFKEQELHNHYNNVHLSQNVISNQNKTNFSIVENHLEFAPGDSNIEALDEEYNKEIIDNYTSEMELQPIIITDTVPMYNIRKPTIKVNKNGNESKSYDIVTTVKNKLHINNEKVL